MPHDLRSEPFGQERDRLAPRAADTHGIGGGLHVPSRPSAKCGKRQITGSAKRTRTEEFLEWCEENPNDVVAILEEENEKKLRELEKEERKAMRELAALAKHEERMRPKRVRATAAELAAVPF
ncbi:MAG: hypothetical protein ACHREM_20795 [Polyangiales bacterium]